MLQLTKTSLEHGDVQGEWTGRAWRSDEEQELELSGADRPVEVAPK